MPNHVELRKTNTYFYGRSSNCYYFNPAATRLMVAHLQIWYV